MKLRRLTLEAVRGVPDGDYDFSEKRAERSFDRCIVIGGAATGKSSLLEGIAALATAVETSGVHPPADPWVRSRASVGRIEAIWELSDREMERAGATERDQRTAWTFRTSGAPSITASDSMTSLLRFGPPATSRVLLLGPERYFSAGGRRLPLIGASPPWWSPYARSNSLECVPWLLADRASRDAAHLDRLLSTAGVVLSSDRPDSLSEVREALTTLAPQLRLIDAEKDESRAVVRFAHVKGWSLTLEQLSTMERQAVLLAVALRLSPHEDCVVLIDTPELGVPARDVARFVDALAKLASPNQLIVATGSEEIARAWPDAVVRLDARQAPVDKESAP